MKFQGGLSAPSIIERRTRIIYPVIPNTGHFSNGFEMEGSAGGILVTPATLPSGTVIAFMVSQGENSPYYPLYSRYGDLIYLNVDINSSRAYSLPDDLFAAVWVQLWSCDSAGSNINQIADKGFTVMLKG